MEAMNNKNNLKIKNIFLALAVPTLLVGVAGGTFMGLSTIFGTSESNQTSAIAYDKDDSETEATETSDEKTESEETEQEISEEDLPDTLPKETKEDYKESEVAFEKKITTVEAIAFSTNTVNEVNLARGKTVISQKGIDGEKKITYLVKYNSKGESLAITKVSEEVTKEPVTQIKKVGVSDYNLNDNIAVTNYASGVCLSSDADANGCKRAAESYNFAQSIEISGVHYVTQIQFDSGTKIVFLKVSDDNFSYNGKKYVYESRYVRSKETLTKTLCDSYGFACGKW